MGDGISPDKGVEFGRVFESEWEQVRKRRSTAFFMGAAEDGGRPTNLVGLALSGGGIRSATFCLGLLQGLNDLKLLRVFDYLSTVSGGGYVGGWWSAWLARDENSARAEYELPTFEADSIRNPANLVVRINQSNDEVSKTLRQQIKGNKDRYNLFAKYREGTAPSRKLVEALAAELNHFLLRTDTNVPPPFRGKVVKCGERQRFGRSMRDAGWSAEQEARARLLEQMKEEAAARAKLFEQAKGNYPWFNRLTLEKVYPYELKDIFPPDEQIEPERRSAGRPGQRGSEGSLCAWQDPTHHLRLFANYLTPRRGMLSADTWRAVSIIARNIVLTWLILLPFLLAATLLGQFYFLLHPNADVSTAFLNPAGRVSFTAIAQPMLAFVGWIAVIAAFWLVFNREKSSATDTIIQTVTIVVLLVLLLAAGNVAINLCGVKFDWVGQPKYIALLGLWAAVLLGLIYYALRPQPETGDFRTPGGGDKGHWRREVLRNRFSHVQTKLLVGMVLCAVVLLVSGYSHVLIRKMFGSIWDPNQRSLANLPRYALGLVPLLSAVGGSIFTAMKATPKGGGEKAVVREPSLVSRIIFAATPVLVVMVMAVSVTALSHVILRQLIGTNLLADKEAVEKAVDILLRAAGSFGVSLCVALAVYEMKNVEWTKVMTPSPGLFLFSFLLAFNASWAVHNVWNNVWTTVLTGKDGDLRFLTGSLSTAPDLPAILIVAAVVLIRIVRSIYPADLLSITPDLLAILTVATIVFIRVVIRRQESGKQKADESKPGKPRFGNLSATLERFGVASGLALAVFITGGVLAGWVLYPRPGGVGQASRLTVLPYGLALMAGGGVLFRLLIVRQTDGTRDFTPRWYKGDGRGTGSVWPLAAVCATLPLFLISWGDVLQELYTETGGNGTWLELRKVGLFPVAVALMLVVLIWLRKLVARAVTTEGLMLAEGARKRFAEWLGRLKVGEHEHWTFRALAVLALGCAIFAPCLPDLPGLSEQSFLSADLVNVAALLLLLSFPIFGVSIFHPPAGQVTSQPAAPADAGATQRMIGSWVLLWAFAAICFLAAAVAGYLLSGWAYHVAQDIPLGPETDGIALLGMTACLTLVIFDMVWATSDNRRSIWLIAGAYIGCCTFLVMGSFQQPDKYVRSIQVVLGMLTTALVWIVALGWMVDPNTVSMHQFYKGRLVRAYLAASNIWRLKHGNKEVTETVAGDDVPLADVNGYERGGPYHLINVTLNLAAGRDLSTAQRSAASFTLAPLYCGSMRTDFRPTNEYMNGQLSLGTAVATSGAAVSPSMGSKKPTAALAMLMTVLNVRLGYWAPTPNHEMWKLAQPRLWPFYLLREFLSQTNDISSYCYLTDGGHFDNTGLYSLVERGCRYIVIADCGADPNKCFQDLGEAIRRCRIDFNAEIDLSLDPLLKGAGGEAKCFVVGSITYSKEHLRRVWGAANVAGEAEEAESRVGVLIYVKPAIIDEVSADVRQYSLENGLFPQQSTANQWFGEAQFESYRRLGEVCVKGVFGGLDEVKQFNDVTSYSEDSIKAIFNALVKQDRHPARLGLTPAPKTPDGGPTDPTH